MNNIHHKATSKDSLYRDIETNLETIFQLWEAGNHSLRLSVSILCAVKLEAFINIAGKLQIEHWDILERKLSFADKCKVIFSTVGLVFDPDDIVNKASIEMFEIRNAIVHPKMKLTHTDKYISGEEYDNLDNAISWEVHHLRPILTKEKIPQLKSSAEAFVKKWGEKLLKGEPDYWLNNGSSGEFSVDPASGGSMDGSIL